MRIIAGKAKGRKLLSPPTLETRPTLDRVKEAMFSMIQGYLMDAIVIDVFAAILLFIPISSIFILLRIEILRVMLPLIIWFTILCKDCFNGRSVGKLLLNFQIKWLYSYDSRLSILEHD